MRKTNVCVFLLLMLGLVCFGVQTARAANGPKASLETVVTQVLDVLKEPGYANPATRPPLRQKIEGLVETIFDFGEFSARTVGGGWAGFSDDQQRRFNEAFARLLLATYLDKINGYNGERIEYNKETVSQKGNRAEVATTVTLSDGKPVPVTYRMMAKNGRWVVYDVIIENVSLIKNYRSQFKEILVKGTPDELIARVLERAEAVSAGTDTAAGK